jgi:hypothetical protein
MQAPNLYTPPAASLLTNSQLPLTEQIEALPVSPAWKDRFHAIALAGGAKLPNFKQLSRQERQRAMRLNVLAFIFGPLYYIAKGMWKKAVVYFVLTVLAATAVGLALEFFGYGHLVRATTVSFGVWFGLRANIDFYKRMVDGENGWW